MYRRRTLIRGAAAATALGYSGCSGPGQHAVNSIPTPHSLDPYCTRTAGQLTLKPGDSIVIRDVVDGRLVDVIKFRLNAISYGIAGGDADFTGTNVAFPVLRERRDVNAVYLTGETGSGKEIASYRIEFLRIEPGDITLRFGPERCAVQWPPR